MINLSTLILNWYFLSRIKTPKSLGLKVKLKNDISADYFIHDFASLLIFDLNTSNIEIKINILHSFITEFFRETSYCYENCCTNNQCMIHYKLHGTLSSSFFTSCINCSNILHNVDYQCIDKICDKCRIQYEIKSLSWTEYPPKYHFYKFGEISGVKSFLRQNNNIIVVHTQTGYYYVYVNEIIENHNSLFTIVDKYEKVVKFNLKLQQFLDFKQYNDNRLKVNIRIDGILFKKINYENFNLEDVKNSIIDIFVTVNKFLKLPWSIGGSFSSLSDVRRSIECFTI